MEAKVETYVLIEKGALVIRRLKNLAHSGEPWNYKLVNLLAASLKGMKQKAKIYYPEKTESEILDILNQYSNQDLLELHNL